MKDTKSLAAVIMTVASTWIGIGQALADVQPPPALMSRYTLELSQELSRVLYAAVQFQSDQEKPLPASGPFGPCVAHERTWSAPSRIPGMQNSLTCVSATSCWYKSAPVCKMSVVAHKGQAHGDLLKVLAEESLAGQ